MTKENLYKAFFTSGNDRRVVGILYQITKIIICLAVALISLATLLSSNIFTQLLNGEEATETTTALYYSLLSMVIVYSVVSTLFLVVLSKKIKVEKLKCEDNSLLLYAKKLLFGEIIYILLAVIAFAVYTTFYFLAIFFADSPSFKLTGAMACMVMIYATVGAYIILVIINFFSTKKRLSADDLIREYNVRAEYLNGNKEAADKLLPLCKGTVVESFSDFLKRKEETDSAVDEVKITEIADSLSTTNDNMPFVEKTPNDTENNLNSKNSSN